MIVNTVAGVPPSPFQANKRLASSVIPGTLSVSHVVISASLDSFTGAPCFCDGVTPHI